MLTPEREKGEREGDGDSWGAEAVVEGPSMIEELLLPNVPCNDSQSWAMTGRGLSRWRRGYREGNRLAGGHSFYFADLLSTKHWIHLICTPDGKRVVTGHYGQEGTKVNYIYFWVMITGQIITWQIAWVDINDTQRRFRGAQGAYHTLNNDDLRGQFTTTMISLTPIWFDSTAFRALLSWVY